MSIRVSEMYVFDIDGVLTNIKTHQIEEEHILDFIINILKKDEPVAFNTGRSLSWVKEKIIAKIENKIGDKNLLSNLFAVAEKGGSWIRFDENGNEISETDETVNIPEEIKNKLREMVKNKFSDKLFYDETKLTMATIQKKDELSFEDFEKIHPKLNKEIEKILNEFDKEKRFRFSPTTLDTDIESAVMGKDYAMGKILGWLGEKGIASDKFITFGDSRGDLDMARHLSVSGHNVKFIFVGKSEINPDDFGFPIIITEQKYDKGTLEYLQSN